MDSGDIFAIACASISVAGIIGIYVYIIYFYKDDRHE